MLRFTLVLALLLVAVSAHAHDEEEDLAAEGGHHHHHGGHSHDEEPKDNVDEKDVIVLTDDGFDSVVAAHKYILVEFYAPWCGHCKTLKAPFAAAATKAKALSPPVAFAKIDAIAHEKVAKRFNIEGFPTLKLFVDSEPLDYNGGRDVDDMVGWVKKRSGPPTEVFTNDDAAFASFVAAHPVVVAGFFAAREGELFQAFEKAAIKANKPFAEGSAAAAATHGATVPSIVLLKNFDEGKAVYEGGANATEIASFVTANARPSVIDFKEELVDEMFGNDLPKVCLFGTNADARAQFDIAAKSPEVRGKVIMIAVPTTADPNFFDFVGVPATQSDALIVQIDASTGKRFRMAPGAAITAASVAQFVADVASGTIKPHLKSAPVPESNNGPVIEVVSSTFKELVIDSDKHVVVEFYAPWCGHCQSLAPIYDKAAAHFREANPDDVVIAKIDGTANEVDLGGINIEGFPTILAFPKGSKDAPVDIGSKPRKNAKQFINTVSKVFHLASARPGEDQYRDAVDRLKVVLKKQPTLLAFVAEELQKVAKAAEDKVGKEGKTEL